MSDARFADGLRYRVEVPSVEGPRAIDDCEPLTTAPNAASSEPTRDAIANVVYRAG